MSQYILFFIFLPFVGYVLSTIPTNTKENSVFGVSILTIGLHLLGSVIFAIFWANQGFPAYSYNGLTLYRSGETSFSLNFYFDKISATYLLVAGTITFLVSIFSRYYMHREKGFKRFYNNLLFFFFGLNVIIFAGNFETLFIGWEIIGITSFFLIAFYRDRYLPVKNALKVISIYRLADICLLIGIWLLHHAFGKSVNFAELNNLNSQSIQIIAEASFQFTIPAVFLIAALVKSAQIPFSSWLPRAMEGPTTSSAVFYGSLSVHMGVFLLIRIVPLWEGNTVMQSIVILLGLSSCIIASSIARTQSSVKTQIAYSSIAQIGLIFVEVALGFHGLAMLHFVGNAFLRTYQLLVSPSVLNYLIHDQFFNFVQPQQTATKTFIDKLKLTFYVLGIKEWHLDTLMYKVLWSPFKYIGSMFSFLTPNAAISMLMPLFVSGLFFVYNKTLVPSNIVHYLPEIFALLGFIAIIRAFVIRENAYAAWGLIIINQLFTSLSIAYNERFDFEQVHIYLSGIVVCGIVGILCLRRLTNEKESISLHQFHGHSYERPRLTVLFLIACLGLSGFPITPTFIGEELLFTHIHHNQMILMALTGISLIINGIAIFRIYARLFLGPHTNGYHEVAHRSS